MINWTSDNQLGRRRQAGARPARDLSLHCTRPLPARCRSRPARPRTGTAPPRAFRRYLTCLGAQGVPRWRPRARALVILVCSLTSRLRTLGQVGGAPRARNGTPTTPDSWTRLAQTTVVRKTTIRRASTSETACTRLFSCLVNGGAVLARRCPRTACWPCLKCTTVCCRCSCTHCRLCMICNHYRPSLQRAHCGSNTRTLCRQTGVVGQWGYNGVK